MSEKVFNENMKKYGFGLMRLPKLEDKKFDIEQIKQMVDRFLEEGFTYFDTAFAYPGSEAAIREALVERYPRESYYLATKVSAWLQCKTAEDARAQLETSLHNLGTDYIDYYLLHNLGETRTHFYDDFDLWNWVQDLKQKGTIRHWGMSFHGTPEELRDILKNHPKPEFIQLQINYSDWNNPDFAAGELYAIAGENDIPVIVMEPVRGGMLADPPANIGEIFKEIHPDWTPASWAMRFCANLENAAVVLSGVSSLEQMEDNLKTMNSLAPFNEAEKEALKKAQDIIDSCHLIPCTKCGYCLKTCPADIFIPGVIRVLNTERIYGLENAKKEIGWNIKSKGSMPDACLKCGSCETACPQKIKITEHMQYAADVLM